MYTYLLSAWRINWLNLKDVIKYRVDGRWQFVDARQTFLLDNNRQLYNSLWSVVVNHLYLLEMMAKYAGIIIIMKCLNSAHGLYCVYNCPFFIGMIYMIYIVDGQKIAKRLSSGIKNKHERPKNF